MIVRSMTGFGSAEAERGKYSVRVEVRSVNNRSIKVSLRLGERLLGLEGWVEKLVREYVSRGSIQVNCTAEDTSGETGYVVDEAALSVYQKQLEAVRKRRGIPGEISLDVLINLPGVVRKSRDQDETLPELRSVTEEALRKACSEMVGMREEEGAFLWKDIVERSAIVEDLLSKVESRVPEMLESYRQRLTQRLEQLLRPLGGELRPEEVHREIALFTDRSDITEEIHRMRSHLAQLKEIAKSDEPVGRKLEFIVQEMFREANTMGSKSNDSMMIQDIVAIKSEVEKLREQAFNVE